ncbi:hypothetical protein SH1V18_10980 [Vallitalea longa]|uniref:ESAT-6-like protein n=1 Tax=Vallitalea longa TaxID=2936439 RepID=A0A9W5YC93_9FIRM|nr:WXG100 family type VII secretion target [Vallitalea longa]GKX28618.1 hypothetical protein SH1V18_10980 [Vallitalea longa]
MSRSITVTPSTLRTQSGTISKKVDYYEELYAKLISEVDELETQWKGKGNKKFAEQIHDFKPKFDKLAEVLNSYCLFLNKAANIYQETENNVFDNANRLGV